MEKVFLSGIGCQFLGSFNMDMRSVYLDTELMLVIDSEAVNEQLKENMQMYEASSAKVLDKDNYEISEKLIQREISAKNKWKLNILKIFNLFRFLM